MVLVVHDSVLGDVRELSDFSLDLAYGTDENAFSLECGADVAPTEGDGDWLDLPYDLSCDLGVPSARSYIDVGEWGAAPLKFTIYGPCTNPAVRIDGNWYRVDATVPDGGYLVVDPLASPRAVTLVNADGSTVDAFPKAHRGEGLGGGEYIFQPASAGTHEVEWDKSFGFDLTWYEEEGEPPWS